MPRGIRALLAAEETRHARNLQSIDGFKLLTEDQKRVALEHVHHPELSKSELADKATLSRTFVYDFFASKEWETVNKELAKRQIKELVQLAVNTLRKSMLFGSASVKLEAALRVLTSEKIVEPKNGPSIVKEDNKIVVLWDDDKENRLQGLNDRLEPLESAEAKPALSCGDQNSVLPAPQTAGNTRVIG